MKKRKKARLVHTAETATMMKRCMKIAAMKNEESRSNDDKKKAKKAKKEKVHSRREENFLRSNMYI